MSGSALCAPYQYHVFKQQSQALEERQAFSLIDRNICLQDSAVASRIGSGDPASSDASFSRGSGRGNGAADATASAPASRRSSGLDSSFRAAAAAEHVLSGTSQHHGYGANTQQTESEQQQQHHHHQSHLLAQPQQQPQPHPPMEQIAVNPANPAWAGGPPAPVPWDGGGGYGLPSGGAPQGGVYDSSAHHSGPAEHATGYGGGAAPGSMYSVPAAGERAHAHQPPPPGMGLPGQYGAPQWSQQPGNAGVPAVHTLDPTSGAAFAQSGYGHGADGSVGMAAAPGRVLAEEELTEVAL